MGDLISREALLRDIEQYHVSDGKFQHWVEVQPSVERHGEWIQKSTGGESFYTCSRCGFIAWEHEDTNYCPNCGADMGGEHSG